MSSTLRIAEPGAAHVPPTFVDPLAMLKECHRRVEDQCATLQRLVPHVARHGADTQAQQAAHAVVRYFDLAAPKHHADEEEDLFPALIESMAGSDAVCLRELIAGLLADHAVLDRHWSVLRIELQKVIEGKPAVLEASTVNAFIEHYAAHIAREERELLPMAERLLLPDAINQIGLSMRRRRGDHSG